jgi:hypothetical protein
MWCRGQGIVYKVRRLGYSVHGFRSAAKDLGFIGFMVYGI